MGCPRVLVLDVEERRGGLDAFDRADGRRGGRRHRDWRCHRRRRPRLRCAQVAVGLALKVARDAQLTRLRTNTCQNDGSPQPTRAEDQVITSNRIQPEGFLGLWLVLMGSMFVAFFTSPPTLKFLSTLKLGFYEKIYPEGRYGKRSSKITKMDALRESLRPPPSTADYREKVIAKLDDISEQLNAQLTKAEYPVGMPVGQGSAKTHP